MSSLRPPFPEHVRPGPRRRRVPWALPLAVLGVAAAVLLPGAWRVRRVVVAADGPLPGALAANLKLLEGTPVPLVDPGWIRDRLESWPGTASVEVRRELDGTLVVHRRTCPPAGSVRTGRGWHGVCTDGSIGVRLEGPVRPVLEGIGTEPGRVRRVLAAVERVRESGFGPPLEVRAVLPGELEVWVGSGRAPARLLLAAAGSRAEAGLRARLHGRPLPPGAFADVSRDDRLVVNLGGEVGS